MSSVFLASAWCLGFSGVPKSGFSGVWGSGALFYTGGSGGFLGFLGFGGSGALFYTGGFRWFARRPLARRRTSPKGDTPGGGHPRRETRPEADIPEGRRARRRNSPKGDTPEGGHPRRETRPEADSRPEADNSKVDTHSLAVVPGPKKSARTGAGALRLRAKSPRPGAGALPPTDRRWILARLSSFGTDI